MRFLLLLISFLACQNPETTDDQTSANTSTPKDSIQQTTPRTPNPESRTSEAYLFSKDFLMGKFNPAKHPEFKQVPDPYTDGDGPYYLQEMVIDAFIEMHQAAKADGISLKIVSATRNFDRQKAIWEAKWTGARQVDGMNLAESMPDPVDRALKILTYSSMPGTSRHHWGTDLDINSVNPSYFEQGKGQEEYEWLAENGTKYGFCQVYTPKGEDRPYGYEEEYWHWSWMPLSKKLIAYARAELKNEDIKGFKGAETATQIDVVKKYVLGVNPECLP